MAAHNMGLVALFCLFTVGSALTLAAKKDNACECLNWYHVYSKMLSFPGKGLELATFHAGGDPGSAIDVVGWLMMADFNKCVNIQKSMRTETYPKTSYNPGTWCYVSSQCQELGDGKAVNKKVSYKTCTEGSGESLRDLTPSELWALLKDESLPDPQMLGIMGFPWVGPPGNMTGGAIGGAQLYQFTEKPQKPVVTASPYSDSFQLHYKDEVWNLRNTAICLEGCTPLWENSGPLAQADLQAIEYEKRTGKPFNPYSNSTGDSE